MVDTDIIRLHPAYLTIMRIRSAISAAVILVGAVAAEIGTPWPTGLILGPAILVIAGYVGLIPWRQFRRKGYAFGADRLRVVSGFLFHSDTVVPFGRVQHLDVLQGPLERFFGLATLALHTAGTHNASVVLHGLSHEEAVSMRETIRAHIKRELS